VSECICSAVFAAAKIEIIKKMDAFTDHMNEAYDIVVGITFIALFLAIGNVCYPCPIRSSLRK
jgi:hypothetical protein